MSEIDMSAVEMKYEVYNTFTNFVICKTHTPVFAINIAVALNEKYGHNTNGISTYAYRKAGE